MNHDDDDDSVVSGLRDVARNVDARQGTSARSPVCHDEGGPHQQAIREGHGHAMMREGPISMHSGKACAYE